MAAKDESGGQFRAATDEKLLEAYRLLAGKEGVFRVDRTFFTAYQLPRGDRAVHAVPPETGGQIAENDEFLGAE